jgi:hypothetical protein
MSTLTYDRGARPDGVENEDDGEGRMPRRPRRRLLTRWSALLAAAMTCAIGFYVGVRVEKGQIASSPTTIGAGAGFAARAGAGTGASGSRSAAGGSATGSSATGSSAGGSSATGSSAGGSSAGGSSAGGAPGAGGFAAAFGAGNATFGTVGSVDGNTLTLTEASGDTVKVKLTSATKITKSESANRRQIHPGDTITVSGLTGKRGTVSAATVTDSGAGTTGTSGTSGTTSSSSSGGSAVSSLFSGG